MMLEETTGVVFRPPESPGLDGALSVSVGDGVHM